tara:strand:+ start:198 stop:530 length:333 start_codon:yes stop_codon:yes gene_type:complete
MNTTFVFTGVLILVVLGFLLLFLFNNLKKESFLSSDGSSFTSQSDLDLYEDLLIKTKPLFSIEEGTSNSQTILGYQKIFLTNLKTDGFKDLKTLIKYRKQFMALSSLINP